MSNDSFTYKQLQLNKTSLGSYYYLFMFQYRTGCRVTEALNLSYTQIENNGEALITGLKGSENRVVCVPECSHLFQRSLDIKLSPFFSCNRFSAYRHLRNLGIGYVKQGRLKASVTHAFRDMKLEKARKLTEDKKVLKNVLGHKSILSQEYYGKDSKK